MTTVADLNIRIDVDGAGKASVELLGVSKAVDEVGDESVGAAAKVDILGTSMGALGAVTSTLKLSGIAVGISAIGGALGSLVSVAGGAVSAIGGAGVAVGGLAAIGITMGVAAGQALKLKYGVDTLGDAFSRLMKEAPIAKALDELDKEFRKLGDGIVRFAREVVPSLIDVFRQMVQVVGPYMEDIGTAISKEVFQWSDLFKDALGPILRNTERWVTELSDIFQHFFTTLAPMAVPGMNALMNVLKGLERGLSSIAKAGEPFIKMIGEGFGKGFQQLGAQLARIVTAFGPTIKPLFKTLALVFRGISVGISAMAPGFKVFLNGLNDGLKALQPGMKALGGALGDILVAAAPLMRVLGKSLTALFKALAPVIAPLANLIATVLVDALKVLTPLFKPIADILLILVQAFTALWEQGIAPVLKALGPVIGDILVAFADALKLLLPSIKPLAKALGDLLLAFMPIIDEALKVLLPMLPDFAKLLVGIVEAALPLIRAVTRLVRQLRPVYGLFFRIITIGTKFAIALLNFVMPAIKFVVRWVSKLVGWLGDLAGIVGRAIGRVVRWFKRMWDAAKRWFGKLFDFIRELPGKVWDKMKEVGKAIWEGLKEGASEAWNGVKGWFGDRFNDLLSFPRGLFGIGSPSKEFAKIGKYLVQGLSKGLGDEQANLERAWKKTMGTFVPGGSAGRRFHVPGAPAAAAAGGGGRASNVTVVTGDLRIRDWEKGTSRLAGIAGQADASDRAYRKRLARMKRRQHGQLR